MPVPVPIMVNILGAIAVVARCDDKRAVGTRCGLWLIKLQLMVAQIARLVLPCCIVGSPFRTNVELITPLQLTHMSRVEMLRQLEPMRSGRCRAPADDAHEAARTSGGVTMLLRAALLTICRRHWWPLRR